MSGRLDPDPWRLVDPWEESGLERAKAVWTRAASISAVPPPVGPRCRCKQRPSESGTWRSSDSHSSSPSGRTVVQEQRPRQEVILEFFGPRFFEVRPRLGGLRLGGTLFSEATPGVA